ncbi:phosphate ABC transporter permease PstA [Candidatus Binatia bacterium]|nr:phosphate ABC transporter permease PstA [Candidatus Binatia bacterium]
MQNLIRRGDPFIWLTGGALATSLLMIVALLLLVLTRALGFFWPNDVVQLSLRDGQTVIGQVRGREAIPAADGGATGAYRIQVQVGNRDISGADFRWVDERDIVGTAYPADAVVLERREWGNLFGMVRDVRVGDEVVASGPAAGWDALVTRLPAAHALNRRIRRIERGTIGDINYAMEQSRLAIKRATERGEDGGAVEAATARLRALDAEYEREYAQLGTLVAQSRVDQVVMSVAGGQTKDVPLTQIVRAYRPNSMSVAAKVRLYLARLWEFVSADPRESNTEGGVFPAIFGTVLMVMIMSVAVVPFGVLAALYLREYARQGAIVRVVRIAVNNLAGVPSIVFGVFGLGFFVYFLGGNLDALFFPERLPTPTFGTGGILWASLTLALLTVPVVIVATEEALGAVPREHREGSLALGATQFETIWRVVLPAALPGILTGLILAMARGAGEVAPLMITGVVKLAPTLPIDGHFPFLHLDRKFMHLGFHIYDVGFQSPNVEAAKPMVYATTLLLLAIVITLNLTAIVIRGRLRRRLAGSTF